MQGVSGSSPLARTTKLRLDAIRVPGAAFSFTQRHALLPCASFAPAKLGRANRATRDLTRSLRLATNFLRKKARAQLFLSGLQPLYKIPAGEARGIFLSCPATDLEPLLLHKLVKILLRAAVLGADGPHRLGVEGKLLLPVQLEGAVAQLLVIGPDTAGAQPQGGAAQVQVLPRGPCPP